MTTKKINLQNKNLVITVNEPDWRKIFEVYLNLDLLRDFVRDEEIMANKKGVQKKLSVTREQPKKYHLIHEKPPQSQFYLFIRGLFFEYGIGLTRPDPIKAYEIYLQGFEENQDSLCAYKLSAILSNPKNKFTVKVDKQKAMFFLTMAAILLDIQYQGNLCDVRTEMQHLIDSYEEGVKLSDILIQKYGGAYFNNEYKKLYTLMFDFQYCHQQQTFEKYTQALSMLEQQIKTYGDQFCLIYLFQLLCQYNRINNKCLKSIIDIGIAAKKECFRAVFSILSKEFYILSKGIRDHILFYNGRLLFYEMYSFIKFFGGPNKYELFPQIFQINEILYDKQILMLKASLHFSLTMRIRSKMYEKGYGVSMNLQMALESINKELNMPKENENYYAYANYIAAKLKRKLSQQYTEQQASEHFSKSWNQFSSRLANETQSSNVSKLVYLYYLARISQLWRQDFQDNQNKFREALNLYLRERHSYKNARTFQYEILCIKIEKKTNSQGQASLYYGHGILSPQNQQNANSAYGQAQFSQPINNMNSPTTGNFNNNQKSNINQINMSQVQNTNQMQNIKQINSSRVPGQDFMQQSNALDNSVRLNQQQQQQNMFDSLSNSQNFGGQFQNQGSQNIQGGLQGNNRMANGNMNSSNQMQQSVGFNQNSPSRSIQQQSTPYLQQSQKINQSQYQQNNLPQQQSQVYNQQSQGLQNSGLNGMNISNSNRNNMNQQDGSVLNSQRIQQNNIIASQLIGNNNNQQNTIFDRPNYYDQQENDMLYSGNRNSNNNTYKGSASPQNRILQPQTGYQNSMITNQNEIPNLKQNMSNPNNYNNTNPNNYSNNNLNYSNQFINPPNSTLSIGNNGVNFGTSNSLNYVNQPSPLRKQGYQSIFGSNGLHSKFLNSGFTHHNIDRQMQEKLTQIKQKRTFYDPKDVIILDFLHRGGNYTTSEAVIINRNKNQYTDGQTIHSTKSNYNDISMISADKLSKLRSFKKHMNISFDDQQILDGEPVVVKQFIISDPRAIDDMFIFIENQERKLTNQSSYINNQSQQQKSQIHQQHLSQVFLAQNLIYIKGFSYQPVSNEAIALYLFYPAQSYNLYGAMKKNNFSLLDKMLITSQICDCIQNLHASSIYQLNLKPSNILFDNKKTPYFSGWEIKKKDSIQNAEENLDEEEQDERLQISYGYSAPEIVNNLQQKNQNSSMTNQHNNYNSTPPRNLQTFNTSTFQNKSQLGNMSTNQTNFQLNPQSDIWSLGMIIHYLFFRIDSGEGNFSRDKRIYGGFNLIITEYTIGSNYFLDKIKEIVEEMVKHDPNQRATLAHVKDVFQRLYIELDTQIKQDHSLNKSYNSTVQTSHTAHKSHNPYSSNPANNHSHSQYSIGQQNLNNFSPNRVIHQNQPSTRQYSAPNRPHTNTANSYSPSNLDNYNNLHTDPYYNNNDPYGMNAHYNKQFDQNSQYINQSIQNANQNHYNNHQVYSNQQSGSSFNNNSYSRGNEHHQRNNSTPYYN